MQSIAVQAMRLNFYKTLRDDRYKNDSPQRAAVGLIASTTGCSIPHPTKINPYRPKSSKIQIDFGESG